MSQLIPVVYHYRKEIYEHILVSQSKDLPFAIRFKHGMQRFAKSYHIRWKIIILEIDAQDFEKATRQFTNYFDGFKDCLLNTTLAMPILGELLGEVVLSSGGEVINYDIFTNKLFLLNQNSTTSTIVASKLTLHSFLTFLDYTIVSQSTKQNLHHRKEHILALYKNPARFNKLRYALLYPELNRDFEFSFYKDLLNILEQLQVVEGNTLIQNKRAFLSGTIFEEYIFWLCQELEFDDIAMGVRIDFDGTTQEPNSNYHIYNEFDILLMKDNKIFVIECKYSNYIDGLELVYKYDAILDYFGSNTKAIVLNISSQQKKSYLGMKSSKNFSYPTLRRAKRSNIYIYHESVLNAKRFQQAVVEQFNLGEMSEDR